MHQNHNYDVIKKSLSKEMYKNIILNYGFRAIGIAMNLLLVRLSLNYLGTTLYGIWATIASIASWVNAGDFGIGNGVRNSIATSSAEGDYAKIRKTIVTACLDLTVVSGILFIILSITIEILLSYQILDSLTKVPMYITNAFFCFDL